MPVLEVSTDDAIRAAVVRLSRPHRSGGFVIERAAILAEGAASGRILEWITAHAGEPEALAPAKTARGLHGARFGGDVAARAPARYILPAGSFDAAD